MSDPASPQSKCVCLFIGTLKAGGAERVTVWIAQELQKMGHQVVVLTHAGAEMDFFALPDGVHREVVGLTEGRETFLGKLMINIRRCWRVRSVLRRYRADAVLAMMPHESVVAVVAAMGVRTRTIVSERNAPWHRRPDKIWSFLRRIVYRFSDAQVAQTQPIADWLRQKTGSKRVVIIPNAVQPELPSGPPVLQPDSLLQPGRKLLLAAGTKPYQKGFDLLAEAFIRVATDHPEWDLAIPGLQPDRVEEGLSGQDVLDIANQAGLSHRLILPGHVGNMADWYRAADLFVLSSRFEGFPNVLVEAMSTGCASISFDCDTGPRDIIDDGRNGILVDMTVEALSAALREAMKNQDLRNHLAAEAPSIAGRYAPDRIISAWCAALGVDRVPEATCG